MNRTYPMIIGDQQTLMDIIIHFFPSSISIITLILAFQELPKSFPLIFDRRGNQRRISQMNNVLRIIFKRNFFILFFLTSNFFNITQVQIFFTLPLTQHRLVFCYGLHQQLLLAFFYYNFTSVIFDMIQPARKVKAVSGVRDFYVCNNQRILIAVVFDSIKIYDVGLGQPINTIKLQSSPRLVKLAPNGHFFAVYDNNTTILIYDTETGSLVQKISHVPHSIKSIRISGNSKKIIFASTQLFCFWDIKSYNYQIYSETWKNINCYDINEDGSQFVYGSYNGALFIISYMGEGKCAQIQIKRHKSCVICVCFHANKLVSASYDGHILITTLATTENGQRLVTYKNVNISAAPREIQSVGDNFYLIDHRGLTWFNPKYVLVGFNDSKPYRPFINEKGETIFVKLVATQFQWWPSKSLGLFFPSKQ